ncbi:MAG: ATPase [Rickettsiales bacterium]|nr:MAG: ATPase [Rickettsiales bacterium]
MSRTKKHRIFVVGNEKGGAGKTTCSMHLIVGLLDRGYKVASIDTDSRQHSLTTYINNRKEYNQKNPKSRVAMPLHFHLKESVHKLLEEKNKHDQIQFDQAFNLAKKHADYIVIDTPGSHTHLSCIAHSYADTVITPVNDSFVDLDVIAKIDTDSLEISKPSIYSQMLWEQKMERAERDKGTIDWVVVRNRLSNLDAKNKRNVSDALTKLAKRISFRVIPGFSERVVFRELFPYGLTVLDLKKANFIKSLSISHVAARQELRAFLDSLDIRS